LVAGKYGQIVAVLQYVHHGFLAFPAAALLARPGGSSELRSSLAPTLTLKRDVVGGGLALLGATLTSYVYVGETIGRGVEEPPTRGAKVQGWRGPDSARSSVPS
jgi:hypothetical protein